MGNNAVDLKNDLNFHKPDNQSASYYTLIDMQPAAPTVYAPKYRTKGTCIHEEVLKGTDLYKVNQMSYESPATLHKR